MSGKVTHFFLLITDAIYLTNFRLTISDSNVRSYDVSIEFYSFMLFLTELASCLLLFMFSVARLGARVFN